MTEACNQVERLAEIKDEMLELLREAEQLVRGSSEEHRAHSYWAAHIRIALDDEHSYMSRGNCTMQSTIDSLAEYQYDDEPEADDNCTGSYP